MAKVAGSKTLLPEGFNPGYLRQLELLRLRSRRAFLGARHGGHTSIKRGHGIEFSDYRKYELGDNPRHIDWGVYGRSDRLYIKRFQEEQALSLLIVIDGSPSMRLSADPGKWEHAQALALSIAYVGLLQHDTVRVCIPGVFDSPAYEGPRAIYRIARDLAQQPIGDQEQLSRGIQSGLSRIRFPGVAVFISDFLFPIEEIGRNLNLFRAKNLDTSALHIIGKLDQDPYRGIGEAILVDSETEEELELSLDLDTREEYQFRLTKHTKLLQELVHSLRFGYAISYAEKDFRSFVLEHLPQIGLLR